MSRPTTKFQPVDWDEPFIYRGYSKGQNHYLVRLSVAGSQRYIGIASTQIEAARLYDRALWKLAPFITHRAKPNFVDEFKELIQRDVDAFPVLNDLYSMLVAEMGFTGDEAKCREAKLTEWLNTKVANSRDTYGLFLTRVQESRIESVRLSVRLSKLRLALELAKLPKVAERVDAYLGLVSALDGAGHELVKLLEDHKSVYTNLKTS